VRNTRQRLVLIGPYDAHDRFVGGAPVAFRNFVASVAQRGVPYRLIDTRKFAGPMHALLNLAWLHLQLLVSIPRARAVMLNGARRGVVDIGPWVYLLCALFGAKFCLRPFGGDFDEVCARVPRWHRFILRHTILRADVLFLETPAPVARYTDTVPRAVWLPNARSRPERAAERRAFARRFVFLSHVSVEKGAGVLLEAAEKLGTAFTVHFYGPIYDAALGERIRASGLYRGVVAHGGALAVLRDYDVLVLPTFAPHEGLPGVIVEAYSIGMPVIATRWRAVPDIVEDGVTGLLVEPHSVDDLAAAMQSVDDAQYARLCAGALHAFGAFDSERVHRGALDIILE
jgi:glycosyltransferase involved in cell wall biosynthesis